MASRPFKIVVNNVVVLHHAYIGAAMMILSLNPFVMISGALILADDIWEHTIEENTPLRMFFDKYIAPRLT